MEDMCGKHCIWLPCFFTLSCTQFTTMVQEYTLELDRNLFHLCASICIFHTSFKPDVRLNCVKISAKSCKLILVTHTLHFIAFIKLCLFALVLTNLFHPISYLSYISSLRMKYRNKYVSINEITEMYLFFLYL